MNESELKSRLRDGYQADERPPPDFDTIWGAAHANVQPASQRRRRLVAGFGVAATAALIALVLWQGIVADTNDGWEVDVDDTLMSATRWNVPSDALLTNSEPGIYDSLPALFMSTEIEVESLL